MKEVVVDRKCAVLEMVHVLAEKFFKPRVQNRILVQLDCRIPGPLIYVSLNRIMATIVANQHM